MPEICVFRPALAANKKQKWRNSAGLRAFVWPVERLFCCFFCVGQRENCGAISF